MEQVNKDKTKLTYLWQGELLAVSQLGIKEGMERTRE